MDRFGNEPPPKMDIVASILIKMEQLEEIRIKPKMIIVPYRIWHDFLAELEYTGFTPNATDGIQFYGLPCKAVRIEAYEEALVCF